MSYSEVVCDEILTESEMAFLCNFEDVGEVWLPKSQIKDADQYNVGDKDVVLHIASWLARKHDLE